MLSEYVLSPLVLTLQAMSEKPLRFSELESENASLKSRNKLLVDTAANSALLEEQVRGDL